MKSHAAGLAGTAEVPYIPDEIAAAPKTPLSCHRKYFRPLALFARLPSARVDRVVVQASENLNKFSCSHPAYSMVVPGL